MPLLACRLARKCAAESSTRCSNRLAWRALVPRFDDLQGQTKLKGKPTPESWRRSSQSMLRSRRPSVSGSRRVNEYARSRSSRIPAESTPRCAEDDAEELRASVSADARCGARAHGDRPLRHGAAARASGARFGSHRGLRSRGDGLSQSLSTPSRPRLQPVIPPSRGERHVRHWLLPTEPRTATAEGPTASTSRDVRGRARRAAHGRDLRNCRFSTRHSRLRPPRVLRRRARHARSPRPSVFNKVEMLCSSARRVLGQKRSRLA